MDTAHTKASWLAIGALLVSGGIGVGALASSLTTEARVWHAPARMPMTEGAVTASVDQEGAGRAWARTAFAGGLRRCPQMNPEFLAACEAEIQALAARPTFAPTGYGGPLLITKMEPVAREGEWDAQERLETPRASRREADFETFPEEEAAPPALDRTPANYPAADTDDMDDAAEDGRPSPS